MAIIQDVNLKGANLEGANIAEAWWIFIEGPGVLKSAGGFRTQMPIRQPLRLKSSVPHCHCTGPELGVVGVMPTITVDSDA